MCLPKPETPWKRSQMAKRVRKYQRPTVVYPPQAELTIHERSASGRARNYKDRNGRIWTRSELEKLRNGNVRSAIAAQLRKQAPDALAIARRHAMDVRYLADRYAVVHNLSVHAVLRSPDFARSLDGYMQHYDARKRVKGARKRRHEARKQVKGARERGKAGDRNCAADIPMSARRSRVISLACRPT